MDGNTKIFTQNDRSYGSEKVKQPTFQPRNYMNIVRLLNRDIVTKLDGIECYIHDFIAIVRQTIPHETLCVYVTHADNALTPKSQATAYTLIG